MEDIKLTHTKIENFFLSFPPGASPKVPSDSKTIYVLGSGVIGLSLSIHLLRSHPSYRVVIIAEHFPPNPFLKEPKNPNYTSSWAGAHHASAAGVGKGDDVTDEERKAGKRLERWEKETLKVFRRWSENEVEGVKGRVGKDVGVMKSMQWEYWTDPDLDSSGPTYLEAFGLPDFTHLPISQLPEGIKSGVSYFSVTIDIPNYLHYLHTLFTSLPNSFSVKTPGPLSSIHDLLTPLKETDRATANVATFSSKAIKTPFPPDAIVNCSGLGARKLGGVEDEKVYPTKGQTVLIKAPWLKDCYTRHSPDSGAYIIPRQSGEVILGGTREPNEWRTSPDPEMIEKIKQRTLELCPELLPAEKRPADGKPGKIEDLDVIEYGAGLRPTRKGGVRLEIEKSLELPLQSGVKVPLVHCYGHGGAGYQSSWGCVFEAVELLDKALPLT